MMLHDAQLLPFQLSTLKTCFSNQKEVKRALCLDLITTLILPDHTPVLFCSRPHDLHHSLVRGYKTIRSCNFQDPLIPDLMISFPPDS